MKLRYEIGDVESPEGTAHKRITLSGYTLLGYHSWDWFCECLFDYDGATIDDVQIDSWGRSYGSVWTYEGTAHKDLTVQATEFEAYRQGRMNGDIGYVGIPQRYNPYVRVKGYPDGTLDVIEKGGEMESPLR